MSDAQLAVGVDLGGTKIHTLVAAPDGSVLGEDRRMTEAAQGPDAVVARIAGSVRAALEQAGVSAARVLGVGISSPGPCDPKRGVVTNAPNLPGFHEIHLAKL